jgi:hypothetical protein
MGHVRELMHAAEMLRKGPVDSAGAACDGLLMCGTAALPLRVRALVDWFCANHPTRARQIERDLRLKMCKQGWRV